VQQQPQQEGDVPYAVQRLNAAMRLLKVIEQKLGIQQVGEIQFCLLKLIPTQPDDWLTVNMTEAREMGLHPRLARNKAELVELLQHKYPMHQFAKMFIMKGKFGQQRRLEQAVSSLFPVGTQHLMSQLISLITYPKDQEILVNARKEPGIVNPKTGDYLELDIWLPTLNLAFEFQVCILSTFVCFSNQSHEGEASLP